MITTASLPFPPASKIGKFFISATSHTPIEGKLSYDAFLGLLGNPAHKDLISATRYDTLLRLVGIERERTDLSAQTQHLPQSIRDILFRQEISREIFGEKGVPLVVIEGKPTYHYTEHLATGYTVANQQLETLPHDLQLLFKELPSVGQSNFTDISYKRFDISKQWVQQLHKTIDNFQPGQTKMRTCIPVGGTHIHDTSLELLPSGLVKIEFRDNETSIVENSFVNTTLILDLRTGWELQCKTSFLAHPLEKITTPRYRPNGSLINPKKVGTLAALDPKRYTPLIPFHGEGPLPTPLLNCYIQSNTAGTRAYAYNTQGERLPSSSILNVTV
jgi:hypothetical protein